MNIEKTIIERYKNDKDMFSKSELVLLFFDIICCPFISCKTKCDLVNYTKFCIQAESIERKIKEISNHKKWFIDWDADIDLEQILKKKEWGDSY